jgi:hypothetical protein
MKSRFRRRPEGYRAPERFIKPGELWEPQAKIIMRRDVTGYAGAKRENVKYHLKAGEVYYVSTDVAAEFITKGYAAGELPRKVSEDEAAEWRAQQTVIRPGG